MPYIIGNPSPIPRTRQAVHREKFTVAVAAAAACTLYTHAYSLYRAQKARGEKARQAKLVVAGRRGARGGGTPPYISGRQERSFTFQPWPITS